MEDNRVQVQSVKKSSFVTFVALGALVFSTASLVSDVFGMVSYTQISHDPMMREAMRLIESQSSGQSLQLYSRWYVPLSVFSILIDLLIIAASIGLFQRREHARKLFLVLLIVTWFLQVSTSISGFKAFQSSAHSMGQQNISDPFSFLYAVAATIWILAVLVISAGIIWKLNTQKIRAEFNRAPKII